MSDLMTQQTSDQVPPLELLEEKEDSIDHDQIIPESYNGIDQIDQIDKLEQKDIEEPKPEEEESVVPMTQSNEIGYTPNGRILEGEEDWEKRPKIEYCDGEMMFRPLRMKCTHCEEAYTKTHDLYAHIRSHQHHTKCPHCGKILTCMATFVYHVRTHTAEKPYYCPMEACDFKNAVKYNLKVHLACIRHGGKNNLKKFAKVLDLDVCEKSLRKRKDNSVHELGSRRSKKRRRIARSSNNDHLRRSHHYHHHSHNASLLKEDDYDQFAAQLLFSLGNAGTAPQYDPNAMSGMHGMHGMNGMGNMMGQYGMNANSQYGVPQHVQYGAAHAMPQQVPQQMQQIDHIEQQNQNINNENVDSKNAVKVENKEFYDPVYGYCTDSASMSVMNDNSNVMQQQQPKQEMSAYDMSQHQAAYANSQYQAYYANNYYQMNYNHQQMMYANAAAGNENSNNNIHNNENGNNINNEDKKEVFDLPPFPNNIADSQVRNALSSLPTNLFQ